MMRFRTRAFLICFVPLAILLAASSWIVQRVVQSAVRAGMKVSLRQNQVAMSNLQLRSDLQSNRFLSVVGDNASLKAGLELMASESDSGSARRTVEDQLLELGEHMNLDLLLVTAADGQSMAGVIRDAALPGQAEGHLRPLGKELLPKIKPGLLMFDGRPFQIASVPVDSNQDSLGTLSVGERFELSAFSSPAVLIHNGAVIMSSVPGASVEEIRRSLDGCSGEADCTLRLHGSDWISLAEPRFSGNDRFVLRSLEDVDAAVKPIQSRLSRIFLLVAGCSLLIVFVCSMASSRSVVRPIAGLVAHMRASAHAGVLTEYERQSSGITEIQELADSYNRAAGSIRTAQDGLQGAYVEFVGSLASALDARDPYTAGHSRRVSRMACAIAASMGLTADKIEQIRIGALLHDVGKIGVADYILQKKTSLTAEEFDAIKQHPVIGRRILEGVQGFASFLPAVELHHENWDGTGYPTRQAGEDVPVDARIIHVADAYDAMTTNRSYRARMSHEVAMRRLSENAGTQFDPHIVETLQRIFSARDTPPEKFLSGVHAAFEERVAEVV